MTKTTAKSRSKTTRTKAKSKKKTGFRPIHHTKRLIKVTPKFIHGAIIGAFVGLVLVLALRSAPPAHATTIIIDGHPVQEEATTTGGNCGVLAVNLPNGQGYFRSFTTTSTTATANFAITGGGACEEQVTVSVWKAPNGSTNFQPYSQQTLVSSKTAWYRYGDNSLTVALPNCDYQVDVLRGNAATGPDGTANYVYPQIVDWLQAGNTTCEPPGKPTPPPTTITTTTPPVTPPSNPTAVPIVTTPTPAPITTAAKTTTTPLPNTGPGAVIIVFLLAVAGGVIFHHYHRHLKHKRKAHAHA